MMIVCFLLLDILIRVNTISVFVISPLIPNRDIVYIDHFVCTVASSRVDVKWIDINNDVSRQCGTHEFLNISLLTSPELFESADSNADLPPFSQINISTFSIRSAKFVRLSLLMRDYSPNSGITSFFRAIETADIVLIGSKIHSSPWTFFTHILSVSSINGPKVVEFTSSMWSLSFIEFLIDIKYHLFRKDNYLAWASCVHANNCMTSDCGHCSWRQHYGNTFTNESLDILSETARAAKKSRVLYGDKFQCIEQYPDNLFHKNGMEVIEHIATSTRHSSSDNVDNDNTAPKILCMTYSTLARREAISSIRDTWGGRCDGYLAFTDETDLTISAIGIVPTKVEENRWVETYEFMWQKAQLMWITVASSRLIDEYDYFLAGGDDLFVHVDNLRELLQSTKFKNLSGEFVIDLTHCAAHNNELFAAGSDGKTPLYIGREMKQNAILRFNTGGAGYVLNRAAVATLYRPFMAGITDEEDICLTQLRVYYEDVMIASCLKQVHSSVV